MALRMLADFTWISFGLLLLVIGGETVVRGSTGLARALGVSPLVIGLTVVAFGTSAPELAVNLIAAFEDRPGISFGNIIGSNMANIGLIVGCTALVQPIVITGVVIQREIPMMLLATAAAIAMAFDGVLTPGAFDAIGRGDGLVLLLLMLVFLFYTIGDFVRQRAANGKAEVEAGLGKPRTGLAGSAFLTVIGLTALLWGAEVTVDAAANLARAFGVPEVIIGLTVLAVGTSLPELVASLTATLRGHAELAIGNVVGSNIFNLLLVMAVTSLIRPIPIPVGGHLDLLVTAVLSLLLFLLSATADGRIIRTEAALLLSVYASYIAWRAL